MVSIQNYNSNHINSLQLRLDRELEIQERKCVYVDYDCKPHTECFFLRQEIKLNFVKNAVKNWLQFYMDLKYLESEDSGFAGSPEIPICEDLVSLMTPKIENYLNYILKTKFYYALAGPFRHLHIDTTQYNHSWSVVTHDGKHEDLGYWIEKNTKIPNCLFYVDLFERFIILKIIKMQALVRMHFNK
jgi:hypothetical protein